MNIHGKEERATHYPGYKRRRHYISRNKNLIEAAKGLGKVVVVAPDKAQSGMGHAITIGNPLRMDKVDMFGDVDFRTNY